MPRRVQDIVSTNRSIRNIPLRKDEILEDVEPTKTHRKSHHEESENTKEKIREIPLRRVSAGSREPHSSSKNPFAWILVSLLVIGIIMVVAWFASVYFSKATFTIVPKKYPIVVNGTYIAQGGAGALTYELLTLAGSASTTVRSSDGPAISTKAKGSIILFNDNKDSQRLVAGTRFSTPSGNIYRLTDSVNIPGRSTKPGTLVASVVADKAGEEYNLFKDNADFDLKAVGFKGTDKYNTVYAQVSTDIIGGFVGSKKIVTATDLATARASLLAQITEELVDKAHKSIPEDHIMYDNIKLVSFTEPMVSGNNTDQATVSIQGTLVGIFFSKSQLVERLASKEAVERFGSFSYETVGLENLDLSIANAKDFSPQKKNSLILKIKGNMELVGVIPVDDIRSKLAGMDLNKTNTILKPYGQVIESGSGELIPPWSKVPKDPGRIAIVVKDK